jgi:hypothetical protein
MSAWIHMDTRPAGLPLSGFVRAPPIQALAAETRPLQLLLFDERDLAEVRPREVFPSDRLIICRNREPAADWQRKREELLSATNGDLECIQAQIRRKRAPPRTAAIGIAVRSVINNRRVGKHFAIGIGDNDLTGQRRPA